jgi:hypothetical protein
VDGFQIGEFVVVSVHTETKEEARVASVHELVRLVLPPSRHRETPHFDKVGLMLLITRCN